MATATITYETVPQDDPRVAPLSWAQQTELAKRYGDTPDHGWVQPGLHPDSQWVLALDAGGTPVGCVAVQPLRATVDGASRTDGEIKRLYVVPDRRGAGHSRALMAAIERVAAGAGYRRLQLETGTRQPEAIALYEGSNWERVPRYGYYRASSCSVCFAKVLPAPETNDAPSRGESAAE